MKNVCLYVCFPNLFQVFYINHWRTTISTHIYVFVSLLCVTKLIEPKRVKLVWVKNARGKIWTTPSTDICIYTYVRSCVMCVCISKNRQKNTDSAGSREGIPLSKHWQEKEETVGMNCSSLWLEEELMSTIHLKGSIEKENCSVSHFSLVCQKKKTMGNNKGGRTVKKRHFFF